MKVSTVKLTEKYLDGVLEIENESFPDPWSYQSYADEIKNPMADYTLLVDENDNVVAFGGFWHILDEGHITNIAVKKEFRQNKLGTLLVSEMIKSAKEKEIKSMTLEVRVSNTPAIKLYEKMGFSSVGKRPKFYSDGEDAFIMWLEDIS